MIIVIMIIFQHIFFIFLLEQKAISTWTFAFSFVFEKYAIYIRKILLVFYYLDSVLISKFYYQFSFRIYFISSIWAIIHYEYGNFEFPVTFHKYFFLCILLRCVRHHHSCNRVHYIRSQDYTHYKILFYCHCYLFYLTTKWGNLICYFTVVSHHLSESWKEFLIIKTRIAKGIKCLMEFSMIWLLRLNMHLKIDFYMHG